jgi:hypothetical protein
MPTQAMEPMLEGIRSNAREMGLQAELVGPLSDGGLESGEAVVGRRFDEDAERQGFMNESLANVEDDRVVRGQDSGELSSQARGVVSGDVDE